MQTIAVDVLLSDSKRIFFGYVCFQPWRALSLPTPHFQRTLQLKVTLNFGVIFVKFKFWR